MGIKWGCGYIMKARRLDEANELDNQCVIGWCGTWLIYPGDIFMDNYYVLNMGQCIRITWTFSAPSGVSNYCVSVWFVNQFHSPQRNLYHSLRPRYYSFLKLNIWMGPLAVSMKGGFYVTFICKLIYIIWFTSVICEILGEQFGCFLAWCTYFDT